MTTTYDARANVTTLHMTVSTRYTFTGQMTTDEALVKLHAQWARIDALRQRKAEG